MKDKFRFTIPACLFAAGCIGSSIYCFFIRNMDNNKTKQLELLLNDEQIKIYYKIVEERRNIFIASKVIGLILAYLVIKYQKLNPMNLWNIKKWPHDTSMHYGKALWKRPHPQTAFTVRACKEARLSGCLLFESDYSALAISRMTGRVIKTG